MLTTSTQRWRDRRCRWRPFASEIGRHGATAIFNASLEHFDDTTHRTKADAEAGHEHFDGQTTE